MVKKEKKIQKINKKIKKVKPTINSQKSNEIHVTGTIVI